MKNRKILSFIVLVLLASLLLPIFTACASGNYVEFKIALADMTKGKQTYTQAIVDKYSDWEDMTEINTITELEGKYDEKFFKKNSLIVIDKSYPRTGNVFKQVEIIKSEDNKLIVKVYDDSPPVYYHHTSYWIVILEVKKSSIKGYTELTVETNFYDDD